MVRNESREKYRRLCSNGSKTRQKLMSTRCVSSGFEIEQTLQVLLYS